MHCSDCSMLPERAPAARRVASATAASAKAATVVPVPYYPAVGCDVTRGPGLGLGENARSVSGTRDYRLVSAVYLFSSF